jgi:hypothetical protein
VSLFFHPEMPNLIDFFDFFVAAQSPMACFRLVGTRRWRSHRNASLARESDSHARR